jgi:sec-independent protein translocase protein TatA
MTFFDAPWHWVLLLLAALLLFGSSRLPGAAKALGSSMNIFKKALKEGAEQGENATTATTVAQEPPAQIANKPSAAQQAHIDELQRQLQDLQGQQATRDATPASDAQPRGQSY